ncbi:bifunctional aconitate hydratase 2/2-methylisocitrate dehydratase [Pelobacter propionicus]|uniref:Aconitate hydratase B n=1 Tax=Pelobacter propionicus (strain DSM 2379 / NBRC 103807 / OttBd1) TaxID=338966 RepID=A1APN5_PELPD|nr:bifunctional aconitate hydratase 2/2-methylisocitrate dehydratase [Pelobacter propionicus]ABK99305.1 aconitase [Pelobacter propionicus DSM 2379]
MIQEYLHHEQERARQGIPPLPLSAEQTARLCALLTAPPSGREEFLLTLLERRVPPGVDPAAKVKAGFLTNIVSGALQSPLLTPFDAIRILGGMLGGYNVAPLVAALSDPELVGEAADQLSRITLVHGAFDQVAALVREGNQAASRVMRSWAEGEWFTRRAPLPATIRLKVYRVQGEINTDDFSPAGDAWSRPDIPLHALVMGRRRFPDGLATMAAFREEGCRIAFVGDVIGTGSSRKSACNSLLWAIGEDIPGVPNKRGGGVIIGGVIAPIFFNTAQDSGALPIRAEVGALSTGDLIVVDTVRGIISDEQGANVLSRFSLAPATLADEFRAGGRIPLIIGRALTDRARSFLGLPGSTLFTLPDNPVPEPGQGFTLAQKMVGAACGVGGVLPGSACQPVMTTVGSQDTTGPMTADELKELACLSFQAPLVMQSFCHTAAYPKLSDLAMHRTLPSFITQRGGVSLRPGDGVIHSWLNRLLLPDRVGTGGDSHTRFPLGISFPAGSGLVAFAAAMGFMPLDMPESVLVRFSGSLNSGITLRDAVNAIPLQAIREGLLTVPKQNKVNIFSGRILEMEGISDLSVEQAFELTDSAAERSAAAGCIQLSEERVAEFLRSNVALMKRMVNEGYQDAESLLRRIRDVELWLDNPLLMRADKNASYAARLRVDLSEIREPILACPNDPDDVRLLSEVAGTPIQDVFIGSCMANIGHFRAAAEIWRGQTFNPQVRIWLCPPTRMDEQQLRDEACFQVFGAVGARMEMPGCSLCMGNQARVPDGVTVFSTSTRNFDDRMGNGARVYLGSAELGAVVALLGRLPEPDEYLRLYRERVEPQRERIYRSLRFDERSEQ